MSEHWTENIGLSWRHGSFYVSRSNYHEQHVEVEEAFELARTLERWVPGLSDRVREAIREMAANAEERVENAAAALVRDTEALGARQQEASALRWRADRLLAE